ncbi:hypothetical protein BOS5A_120051 [Bosea sp. EC-HK365B]|nr:hypothetical protein BOSE21B_111343 [Bosea sp. 21B]VVT55665.1 hypothetical protein BOS5A_120051 [Bosea sp. EC-HK365B]
MGAGRIRPVPCRQRGRVGAHHRSSSEGGSRGRPLPRLGRPNLRDAGDELRRGVGHFSWSSRTSGDSRADPGSMPEPSRKRFRHRSRVFATLRPGRHGDWVNLEPPEHHAEIVRRHRRHSWLTEAGGSCKLGDSFELAQTPFRIAPAQAVVEDGVACRQRHVVLAIGAVEIERPAGRQKLCRLPDQPLGRRPGRDVDHVDAQDRIRIGDRPARCHRIEPDGRAQVRQSALACPGVDAGQRSRIGVARLEAQVRKGGCEVDGMLAGAAGDLQHEPLMREHFAEHGKDRLAVALCRRGKLAGIMVMEIVLGHRLLPSRSAVNAL